MLGNFQHGVDGHREEEAGGVDKLGGGDQGPVCLLLQVRDGEVVRSVQFGHQRSVLVSDQNCTSSGGLLTCLIPSEK